MARVNLTHETHSDSVFVIAEMLSHTAEDRNAIRHEQDLERIYQLRRAASRRRCGSSLDSLKLRQIVGWS